MSIFALAGLWHWITAWWPIMLSYGVAGLWIAGLVAAAVFLPWISFKVRVAFIVVASIILLCTASFTVGIKKGADRVKADWDWSIDVEAKDGEQDRTDAVRDLGTRSDRSGLRDNDPWNRDGWQKREGD